MIPATCRANEYFDVYLLNWNKCNPYGIFDPVAGHNYDPVITHVRIKVVAAPAIPNASDVTLCFTGNPALSILTASHGSPAGNVLKWYSNSDKTGYLNSGLTFSPGVSAVGTYTYYVADGQTSGNLCEGPARAVTLTIREALNLTDPITGPSPVCLGETGLVYSLPNPPANQTVGGPTEYNWTIPVGWSNFSGNGTRQITADATGTAGPKTLSVDWRYTSAPTCVSTVTLPVTVSPAAPSAPTANAGSGAGCSQITANWSASTNATKYYLDVSTVNNFASFVGIYNNLDVGNVTSYNVTGLSSGTTYYYRVRASNSCGTSISSNVRSYATSPSTPADPGSITGTTPQCPALTNQVYSISAVTNATTYTWTVPAGWSITGGAGTTSINVTTGSAGQNGNITVTAGNSCGTSGASTLAVTVSPAKPGTPGIITGTTPQCPGLTGQIYSISAVARATSYSWSVPAGWTITAGDGTTSITVTTGSAGQNGNIVVNASNSCGTSGNRTKAVTVNPGTPATPGAITGTTTQCPALTVRFIA